MKKIAVVGAGIAGLTCAYELKKAGFSVEVFEKHPYVGGRMSTRVKDGFYFDIGANHLVPLYKEMVALCEELGVKWQKLKDVNYKIYNGHTVPLKNALSFTARMKLALAMLRAKDTEFLDLSQSIQYDTIDAYTYARQKLGPEVADYVVDPFTSTYEFHRSNEISKAALIALMYSIKRNKDQWQLYGAINGMSALPDALAKQLDVKLKTPVVRVIAKEHSVLVTTQDEKEYDAVVLASTAPITKQIYQNPTEKQSELLDKVKYATTITVAFKAPVDVLKDLSMVWVPYAECKTIASYSNEAKKGEEVTQDGKTLLCLWFHEEFAKTLMDKSDEEIFTVAREEISKICEYIKDPSVLENFDLKKWQNAMPKFPYQYITDVANFLKEGQGEQNVFFCGDYLNSPWTEGALRCGKRVAQEISTKFSEAQQ